MIDPALRTLPGLPALIVGRIFSQLSATTMTIAIGWQIYALTHDVASLGYLGLAQFLPMIPLTFVAGHVADRLNRRTIALVCQICEMLSTAALAVAAALHGLTTGGIYAFAAFYGVLRSFEMPCQQAFLPAIAPPSLLPRAQALLSSLFMTASIVGPSLGGLLYGIGPVVCYGLSTIGFAVAFSGTFSLKLVHTVPPKEPITFARSLLVSPFLTAAATCWGRLRSICSPFFWAALQPCSRFMPTVSCMSVRSGWDCFARLRRLAHS